MPTCPRRTFEFGPWEHTEGLDDFRDDDTCSFCGSLNPVAFFQAVRSGYEITPTDKNYKAYVNVPGWRFAKFYFQHLSGAQRAEFIALYNDHTMKVEGGSFYVMPYFTQAVVDGAGEAI